MRLQERPLYKMRLIVLDTETTGLDFNDGHKIIEIGCVEIINRKITNNIYHQYIRPNKMIDDKAREIHGITNEFLEDKPLFSEIINQFIQYLSDSDLIMHNAPFDVGFLKKELENAKHDPDLIDGRRNVYDTLKIARNINPGKRNTLDALCDRYSIDREARDRHGALLDASLLANVYLKMTMGQTNISGLSETSKELQRSETQLIDNRKQRVISADKEEVADHQNYFNK